MSVLETSGALKLYSRLPASRYDAGLLWGEISNEMVYGHVRCRGEADNTQAAAHNNVIEDPTKAYGDHPSGVYLISDVVPVTPPNDMYGPYFLRLKPVSGQCLEAATNGRRGFGIHGGRLHNDGRLRETYGCLRVDNRSVLELVALIRREHNDVSYECIVR